MEDRRLNHPEAVILSLLSTHGELGGLGLVKLSDGHLGRGTVYVHLTSLEDDGLVTSREDAIVDPRIGIPRRLYRITHDGSRCLAARELGGGLLPA